MMLKCNKGKTLHIFFFVFFFSTVLFGQQATLIKVDRLNAEIKNETEKIQVVNFWATWCGSCVKELHLFDALGKDRNDVLVRLVSLDLDLNPDPKVVHRFIDKKKILSEVLILDESNPNEWIDKVDSRWTGALPATLVVNNKTGKRKFVQEMLTKESLDELIQMVE